MYFYKKPNADTPTYKIIILSILRFLSLSLILLLIFNPAFEINKKQTQKPVILFAQDNSKSVPYGLDSIGYKQSEYATEVKSLIGSLQKDYKVQTINFGSETKQSATFNFTDESTNFTNLFNYIQNQYVNANIGAVIISSDGIFNKGSNPIYESSKLNAPIYTIAIGDTNLHKDAFIKKVEYNKTNFVGNYSPIAVHVMVSNLKNNVLRLDVLKNNQVIEQKNIVVNSDNFFDKVTFLLKNEKSGIHKYTIKLSELTDEFSTENNVREIVVETHEKKQKILLVQQSYHPDCGVIKRVAEQNKAYEVDIKNAKDKIENLNDYNLVILHQLPSMSYGVSSLLKQIVKQKKSVLFVLGEKSSLPALNALQIGFSITDFKNIFDHTKVGINNKFTLFELNNLPDELNFFPPLTVPFANYPNIVDNNIMFYQKVGMLKTNKPLIFFTENGTQRVGVISGEGIWRWFMAEYDANQNQEISTDIVQKIIQFLIVTDQNKRFIVDVPTENSELGVKISAKLYNKSYELINKPDVSFEISDDKGKKYPHTFQKTANAYQLNLKLPIGTYRYKATAQLGTEQFEEKGSFIVKHSQLEAQNLQADFNLLYNLADKNGGKMFMPKQMQSIADEIKNNPNIKEISYNLTELETLISKKILFFIILLLLSAEWFFRKFWGLK